MPLVKGAGEQVRFLGTGAEDVRGFHVKRSCDNITEYPQIMCKGVKSMEMWQCQTANCGYIYNPAKGDRKGKIPAGTPFEELPEEWKCPVCGAGKHLFKKIE